MIIKSFEIDKIKKQQNDLFLLYGSNKGYKKEIINNYLINDFKGEILFLDETEVLSNDKFIEELLTKSLFDKKKKIIISNASDKLFNIISEINEKNIEDIKIIINCEILEKKSKLRNLFEKEKKLVCIPFYEDNKRTLSIIAQNFLNKKNIKISQEILNLLVERSKGDRINLNNELQKIESLSLTKKNIKIEDIQILSNLAENYSVSELSDNYLAKNTKRVSHILNENNYNSDDCVMILRTILNRSKRLLKLKNSIEKNNNLDLAISTFKPPIFWKEKDIVKTQLQNWSQTEIKKIIYKINDIELMVKKNSSNSINFISDFVRNY